MHPAELLRAVQPRRGGRLRRGDVLGPLLARGASGRATPASRGRGSARRWRRTDLPFGVVNAPGPALPPGDRRPGDRDAGRDVPGRLLGGARHRARHSNEHITGDGWPRKEVRERPAARVRATSSARCSPARRSATTASCTVDRARLWTLPDEPPPLVGAAVSAETAAVARRLGRRAGHRQPAARHAARGGRRLPRRRRPRPSRAAGARVAGPRRGRGAARSPTTSGARNVVRPAGLLGPRHRRGLRRRSARTCRPRPCADVGARLSRPGAARGLAARARRPRLRRALPAPRRAGAAGRSSTRSASTCCPQLTGRPVRITDTSDLWWKTAVVYCLDVETFLDWDGDGVGDFAGLAQRIDYLAELGVTCLWLMPFYPTPDRDDGYDITDFYGVDPRLGTHGDFVELIRTAQRPRHARHRRPRRQPHLRPAPVVPVGARRARTRRYRDCYVWRDAAAGRPPAEVVFPDQETSVWELRRDDRRSTTCTASTSTSPTSTSPTRRCATRSPRSWGSGSSSASPASGSTPCRSCSRARAPRRRTATSRDPHDYLRTLRAFLGRRSGDAILLGEVNLPHEDQLEFFGGADGDELTMQFDFIGMQQTLPVAGPRRRAPAGRGAAQRRPRCATAQWATFVRNHDELTLDKLTDAERAGGVRRLRPGARDAGLRPRAAAPAAADARRRPAPDPDGLQPAVLAARARRCCSTARRSAWARTSTADGRQAVRTPMQWTGEQRNGGFSTPRRRGCPTRWSRAAFGPRARQRRRPAPRPGLAAGFMTHAGAPLPRVPRAGLGRLRGARPAAPAGARAPARTGTTA